MNADTGVGSNEPFTLTPSRASSSRRTGSERSGGTLDNELLGRAVATFVLAARG